MGYILFLGEMPTHLQLKGRLLLPYVPSVGGDHHRRADQRSRNASTTRMLAIEGKRTGGRCRRLPWRFLEISIVTHALTSQVPRNAVCSLAGLPTCKAPAEGRPGARLHHLPRFGASDAGAWTDRRTSRRGRPLRLNRATVHEGEEGSGCISPESTMVHFPYRAF